ncbi:hypothetical protein DO70_6535 [Burkholderia pseudomallei]|nr:hypothetical protein DO70_6535 [Burkholderia pseudomallei]
MAERNEVQTGAALVRPRRRAAQHLRLRLEALLLGALHVRVGGRVLELLVVVLAAADDAVHFVARNLAHLAEVVHPLLNRDEARAVEPRALAGHERDFERLVALRVLGAVLVAGQVAVVRVTERVRRRIELERGRDEPLDVARAHGGRAEIVGAQPDPQRRGSRRHRRARHRQLGKLLQPVDLPVERLHERRPEADHRVNAVERVAQRGEHARRMLRMRDPERQVAARGRNRSQNAWLKIAHRFLDAMFGSTGDVGLSHNVGTRRFGKSVRKPRPGAVSRRPFWAGGAGRARSGVRTRARASRTSRGVRFRPSRRASADPMPPRARRRAARRTRC